MEGISHNKYDPIRQILFFLFSIDDIYKDKEKIMDNVQVLIDEEKLGDEIKRQWHYLLGNSEDYNVLAEKFIKKSYTTWRRKLETFQNIKNEEETKKFIKENFPLSMMIRYETGALSRNEILRFLEFKEPKIKDYFNGRYGKYLNFLIYQNNLLHINLHLKIKEYTTGTYGLLIICSFWIDEPEYFDTLDINIINENYSSSILCYKVITKLISLNFKRLSLFNAQEYREEKYSSNINNEWVKFLPHFFITTGIEIINENPLFLFEDLVSKLNQVELVINKHSNTPIFNPNEWYKSLSLEVQTFIEKGKELFLKIEEKELELEKEKIEEKVKVNEYKENDLIIEDVALLFKDALQKDRKDENIIKDNEGFRTINSFFKEYKNKLKGRSIQTIYNYFKQWDLNYYLESRESTRQGGGKEYRYREGFMTQKISSDKQLIESTEQKDEIFQKEKIQIQQALNYYNNQKYENAKALLIKISKNPSKDLFNDDQLYYGVWYYISRCYQKLEDYTNATSYFKKIYSKKKDFINVNFHYIESSLEAGMYRETLQIINHTLNNLKDLLKIFDLTNYYMIYDDLEFIIRSITWKYDSINDGLRPYIEYLENNDFKKSIIGINKTKPDLRILRKPFDEKDYTIIYHNLMLTEKFYETLIRIWFLKSECFRRCIIKKFLNQNFDNLDQIFREVIIFFKKIQQLNLRSKYPFIDILSFVYYYIGLTKLFDLIDIQKELEENFPEGKGFHYSPEFRNLKKYKIIYYYLNAVNQSFNSPKNVFRYEIKSIREKKPILVSSEIKAELYFIKISLLQKYVLDELLNEERSFLQSIKNSDTEDIHEIYRNWDDFHFPFHSFRNLIYYNELFSEFEEICHKYNIEIYKFWVKRLQSSLFDKLKEVKELRIEGRTYALNCIFKILYSKYTQKIHEFEVFTKEKPEDLSIEYFIYDSIKTEINSIKQKKVGQIRAKLDVENKHLIKHILSYIKKHGFFIGDNLDLDFSLWLDFEFQFEENVDILEFYYKINLTYERVRFKEHLDIIPLALFHVIDMNADELYIQISDKFKKEFKTYFQEQFPKEYQNEFFKFTPMFILKKNMFKIKIKKL